MHISDFLQILQKFTKIYGLTTSSISKTRGILLRFKMAADFKMTVKNWFFDHNSVNNKCFYVLSFAICNFNLSYNTNFIEEKFLSCTKWRRKLKMVAKFQWAVTFF
jgi:hypothetical protein